MLADIKHRFAPFTMKTHLPHLLRKALLAAVMGAAGLVAADETEFIFHATEDISDTQEYDETRNNIYFAFRDNTSTVQYHYFVTPDGKTIRSTSKELSFGAIYAAVGVPDFQESDTEAVKRIPCGLVDLRPGTYVTADNYISCDFLVIEEGATVQGRYFPEESIACVVMNHNWVDLKKDAFFSCYRYEGGSIHAEDGADIVIYNDAKMGQSYSFCSTPDSSTNWYMERYADRDSHSLYLGTGATMKVSRWLTAPGLVDLGKDSYLEARNAAFDRVVTLGENARMVVGNSLTLNDSMYLKSGSKLTVRSMEVGNILHMEDNSTLEADSTVTMNRGITLGENCTLKTGHLTMKENHLEVKNGTSVTVADGELTGAMTVSGGKFTSHGDFSVGNTLAVQNGSFKTDDGESALEGATFVLGAGATLSVGGNVSVLGDMELTHGAKLKQHYSLDTSVGGNLVLNSGAEIDSLIWKFNVGGNVALNDAALKLNPELDTTLKAGGNVTIGQGSTLSGLSYLNAAGGVTLATGSTTGYLYQVNADSFTKEKGAVWTPAEGESIELNCKNDISLTGEGSEKLNFWGITQENKNATLSVSGNGFLVNVETDHHSDYALSVGKLNVTDGARMNVEKLSCANGLTLDNGRLFAWEAPSYGTPNPSDITVESGNVSVKNHSQLQTSGSLILKNGNLTTQNSDVRVGGTIDVKGSLNMYNSEFDSTVCQVQADSVTANNVQLGVGVDMTVANDMEVKSLFWLNYGSLTVGGNLEMYGQMHDQSRGGVCIGGDLNMHRDYTLVNPSYGFTVNTTDHFEVKGKAEIEWQMVLQKGANVTFGSLNQTVMDNADLMEGATLKLGDTSSFAAREVTLHKNAAIVQEKGTLTMLGYLNMSESGASISGAEKLVVDHQLTLGEGAVIGCDLEAQRIETSGNAALKNQNVRVKGDIVVGGASLTFNHVQAEVDRDLIVSRGKVVVENGSSVTVSDIRRDLNPGGKLESVEVKDSTLTVKDMIYTDLLSVQNGTVNLNGSGPRSIENLSLNNARLQILTATGEVPETPYDLVVQGLTVTGDSYMEGNLWIQDRSKVTFMNGAVLTMGCSVVLGNELDLTLEGYDAENPADSIFYAFQDVEELKLWKSGDNIVTVEDGLWYDLYGTVNSINGKQITGAGQFYIGWDKETGRALFSTVPEPATATLSLLALAGLATRRRRK